MSKSVGVKRKASSSDTGDSLKKSKLSSLKDGSSKPKKSSRKDDVTEKSIKSDKKEKKDKKKRSEPVPEPESESDEEEPVADDMDVDVEEQEDERFQGFDPLEDEGSDVDMDGGSSARPAGNPSEPGKGTSSEAHAKQKALAKERRASRPNSDLILRSKRIWEQLRKTSEVTPEERRRLVGELLELISGRTHDFVFKHDSGRVIQCALKFAPKEYKLKIATELKGSYRALSESKYAKFLVAKLLVHGGDELRDMVISEFYGHVRKLINHPEAAWILDDIYRGIATPKQKALMLREWYGAEFAIFKDGSETPNADLKALLEQSPEKRKPIMDALKGLINPLVQKKKSGFTMLHDAMLQYFLNISPDSPECKEFFELLQSDEEFDLLKNLAFTPSGSRLVCLALARGTASNRKQILRAYKGVFSEMACDPNAHAVLIASYEVIDDTKLVAKSIFSEILGKSPEDEEFKGAVSELAFNTHGRISLLYPLSSGQKWFLNATYAPLLAEIREASKTTSKKGADIRRSELVGYLSPFLLAGVARSVSDLVGFPTGCQCITETLLSATGNKSEVADAVADLAAGDPAENPDHVVNNPGRSRMLKAIVRGGRFDSSTTAEDGAGTTDADGTLKFASRLWPVIEPHVVSWATGEGAFVVLAMLEIAEWDGKAAFVATLQKNVKKLQKAVKAAESAQAKGVAVAPAEVAVEVKKSKKTKKDGKDKPKDDKPRSVMPGTKLILSTLAAL